MRYFDLELTPLIGKTYTEQNEKGTRIESTDSRVSIFFQSIDKVKYDRYFDEDGYPQVKEYALDDNLKRYSLYSDTSDSDGVYQPDLEAIENTILELAKTEARETRVVQFEAMDLYDKAVLREDVEETEEERAARDIFRNTWLSVPENYTDTSVEVSSLYPDMPDKITAFL